MAQVPARAVPAPSRFEALDAWRGICALLVAFLHAAFDHPFIAAPAFANLQFCVDIFFVLSGFVLLHGYGARLSTGPEIRRFAIARFGRLWPLHAAALGLFVLIEAVRLAASHHAGAIAVAAEPFGPGRRPGEIVDNLLMLQAIGPTGTLSWNFPAWSVAVEFWTSLVFAGVVWAFGPRRILPFLVLALASGLLLHRLSPASPFLIERWGIVRCLCDFFVGCLAYRLRPIVQPALRGVPAPGASALELALVALAATLVLAVRPGPLGAVAPPLFGAFVLLFSFERGAVSRLLRAPMLQALGRWSFSIYLLHVPVFEIAHVAAHVAEARFGRTLIVPYDGGQLITTGSQIADLGLALAVIAFGVVPLAALSHRFVERPALAFFKALADRSAPRGFAPRLTVSRQLP